MESFNASLEAFNAPVNSLVWGWPTGVDELLQLWGRAGRDGLPAQV